MSDASKRPGLLLVLSAPSGAGKTTLARRLVDTHQDCVFSISYTTRSPRGAERDGVDYFFVDEAAFQRMIDAEEFAEWAQVHGKRYGTPRQVIDLNLDAGRVVIFDIDVQGGEQLKGRYPEAATVLVVPPSMAELERRLRDRRTESEEAIARRLAAARAEVRRGLDGYDFVVVNDDLDTAFADFEAIVRAERLRRARPAVARGLAKG